MSEFKVKKLREDAILPTRANPKDAGLDLYSTDRIILHPGMRFTACTGISIEVPEGFAGFVQPKSGRASKEGLTVLNTPGLIDVGYTGEIQVILQNSNNPPTYNYGYWWGNTWVQPQYDWSANIINIEPGQKIAQLVFVKIGYFDPAIVSELDETDRGDGGFGSSGLIKEVGESSTDDFPINFDHVIPKHFTEEKLRRH